MLDTKKFEANALIRNYLTSHSERKQLDLFWDMFVVVFLAHLAITWCPSSINLSHFNLLLWNISPLAILVSDCPDFLKSSCLKPLYQMNRNLVGSIYGRSSIKIANFIPICLQTWLPQAILVSGWLISKNLLLWNCLAKWTETWWEAPMEGSVLSFLQAEWKVSYTGSAHWASSFLIEFMEQVCDIYFYFRNRMAIFGEENCIRLLWKNHHLNF